MTVHHDQPTADEATTRLVDADLAIIGTHLTPEGLGRLAARTRLLAFAGTGAASYIDLPTARHLGITVTNVTGYGDRAVAELALALLLAAARGVLDGDRAIRTGDWTGFPGPELFGSTIGVVGVGAVGRVFTTMVAALGMRVLAYDARPVADLTALGGPTARQVGLEELLAVSDAVSLHLPLNDATRGLLTPRHLDLLRPGTILVNTARAELIAPGALAARLARGDLRAACDVFDPEPLPADDPLLTAPNTVLTPHLGFRTPQALGRMAEGAVECVEAFVAGRPVRVVS
ncbi:MAG: D-2-hydroxyacid dehydrogenase family protein [Actinobacteria bacterium]|nr:D-2-hydroxyacid dehydrogenase family protein [Actinomycetota bacterium]MCG2802735.1 D-2-hydroxyacid dehydrogenase family protein [Cellulomonas sp.]